jgi:hypothetical protein
MCRYQFLPESTAGSPLGDMIMYNPQRVVMVIMVVVAMPVERLLKVGELYDNSATTFVLVALN